MKRLKYITIVLIIVTILIESIKRIPIIVETFYSRFFYVSFSTILNSISNWISFSIGEIVLFLTVVLTIIFVTLIIKKSFTTNPTISFLNRLAHIIVTSILSVSLIFNMAWGLNYYRYPLSKHLGITVEKHSKDELIKLCEKLIDQANNLALEVPHNQNGVASLTGGYIYVFENANLGYLELGKSYAIFSESYKTAKPVASSWLMSYLGISGIYSPLTAEANININIEDVMLPSTTMHEMAHLYGIARENEANFAAYLSCINHPDPAFQYSGTMLALIHSMNALHKTSTTDYLELRGQYSEYVLNDLRAISKFWSQYEGAAEELNNKMNDRYLKANGQAQGVKSYGEMVDLLLELDQIENGFL